MERYRLNITDMNQTPITIWVMPSPVAHPEKEQLPMIVIALVKLAAECDNQRTTIPHIYGFHYPDSAPLSSYLQLDIQHSRILGQVVINLDDNQLVTKCKKSEMT